MKKTFILIAALLISVSAFSQRRTKSFFGWHLAKDEPVKLNEVKLNLGTTIFALYPEFSYERILSEDFGVGASAGIGLNSEDSEYDLHFSFMPYARWYFGGDAANLQKYGAGFYLELNAALISRPVDGYTTGVVSQTGLGAGVGLGIGWKYLSKNNWVGEFMLGLGRDFVNDMPYPRAGITLGRRF